MKTAKTRALLIAASGLLVGCGSTPMPRDTSAEPFERAVPVISRDTRASAKGISTAPSPTALTSAATTALAVASVSPSVESTIALAPTVATVTLNSQLGASGAPTAETSIYFDYDEFAVKPEYAAVIVQHGTYLISHPDVTIKIEGHADERGGSEYNLTLGQKRADAVLRTLRIYGVKASQLEAISFGEERPSTTEHDEAAWAKERRADLQYATR